MNRNHFLFWRIQQGQTKYIHHTSVLWYRVWNSDFLTSFMMIAPVFISVFLRKVVIKRGRMGRFDTRGIYFWHLFVWRESSQPFLAVPKGAKRRSKKITLKNISSNRWSHIYFDIIQCKFDVLFQFFCFEVHNQPTVHLYSVVDRDRFAPGCFWHLGLPSNAVNKRSFGVLSWFCLFFLLSNHNDNVKRHDTTSLTLKAKVIAGGCFNFVSPCCCIAMQGQLCFRLKGSGQLRSTSP